MDSKDLEKINKRMKLEGEPFYRLHYKSKSSIHDDELNRAKRIAQGMKATVFDYELLEALDRLIQEKDFSVIDCAEQIKKIIALYLFKGLYEKEELYNAKETSS